MTFERITVDPARVGGVPCVRGLRIPVATVVAMLADGMTNAEIVSELSDLTDDDVREVLQFAAEAVRARPGSHLAQSKKGDQIDRVLVNQGDADEFPAPLAESFGGYGDRGRRGHRQTGVGHDVQMPEGIPPQVALAVDHRGSMGLA